MNINNDIIGLTVSRLTRKNQRNYTVALVVGRDMFRTVE